MLNHTLDLMEPMLRGITGQLLIIAILITIIARETLTLTRVNKALVVMTAISTIETLITIVLTIK